MKLVLAKILVAVGLLSLVACEAPDIKGLNSMPKKTAEMSNKMDTTNDAIHKQALLVALEQLDKEENQELTFPIPTGLMAAGKAFAEEATAQELMEFTYIRLRELEEVNPVKGLDKDGMPLTLTEDDLAKIRIQKMAKLYGLMTIAGFTPDAADAAANGKLHDRLTEILNKYILGNNRYQKTALNFLALRAFFIREVLLKLSLKVSNDEPDVLENSGYMQEALKYLLKLDQISRLPYADRVQVHVQEKEHNLLTFDEKQDIEGQKATAQIWSVALAKAQAGMKNYQQLNWTNNQSADKQSYQNELARQAQIIQVMQKHAEVWALH